MPRDDATTTPGVDPLDARLGPPLRAVCDPAVRVVSVDVFDTLLWRRVPDPVDAFDLVAERLHELGLLLERVKPRVFAGLRIAAEHQARRRRQDTDGRTEIELVDIYEELAHASLFGHPPDLHRLALGEIEIERELLVPDLDIVALLDVAREHGKQVVAVSDLSLIHI